MSLRLEIKGDELYDSKTNKFIEIKPTVLTLEHSLISIFKWEGKYRVPFLKEDEKNAKQIEDYFKCMTINQNVDPIVYKGITPSQQQEILDYIKNPMTATWFGKKNEKSKGISKKNQVITSELIYAWMVLLQIPPEYDRWHLNRLLTLIEILNEYNKDPKKNKKSKNEIRQDYDALNDARRAAMKTRG